MDANTHFQDQCNVCFKPGLYILALQCRDRQARPCHGTDACRSALCGVAIQGKDRHRRGTAKHFTVLVSYDCQTFDIPYHR